MFLSSWKKLPFNTRPANRLASPSTQQPRLVCTWSAHAPQSGSSPSPFPRSSHTLTATATAAGELFLFGGYVHGCASSDLYVFSTRDFSTTLLRTSGEAPIPRVAHGTALIGPTLLICGGKTNFDNQIQCQDDSLYLLDLKSREWTRVMIDNPGPGGRYYHTVTKVGSELFVIGGLIGGNVFNDMWTLDLNCLKSQPLWELYESTPGNEMPLPRTGHISVTTEDRIIIFGGTGNQHHYNDTWSLDISTRKWTELQCTGSVPSPRARHAAVLVDDVIYVFGGFSMDERYLDDLYALQLSTRRWFEFHSEGSSPHGRSAHAMASDGTRVFVLGGYSKDARSDEISLIHVFDTKHIKFPDPEPDAVDLNTKTTQLARRSSTGLSTQEQPLYLAPSSSEAHSASRLQYATLAVSGRPAPMQVTRGRNPGPNDRPLELTGVNSIPRRVLEDNVSEGSTGYHAKCAAPHSSSEGEIASLEYEYIMRPERQLSASPTAITERDQQIAQLAAKLALKCALLEQAEANAAEAVEAAKRAGLEIREQADQLLIQTSLAKQREVELRYMQAKLDELLQSRDQQIGQHEKDLANIRAKLEAKESELEAVRLRLTDAEKGWIKSKTEADMLRTQTATGSVNLNTRDEDQVTHRLMERMRAIEVEMTSKRWNEKTIEDMECRNEG